MLETIKTKLLILCLCAANATFLSYASLLFATSFYELYFSKPDWNNASTLKISVKKNESIHHITDLLRKQQLIQKESAFRKWLILLGLDTRIQYGTFNFKSPPTLWQVIKTLTHNHIGSSRITILEGLNTHQISKKLTLYGFDTKIFTNLTKDPHFISSLGILAPSLEGFLFPDTYFVNEGSQEDELIQRMVKRFHESIQSLNLEQSVMYKTAGLYKGLIIASLVEKETHFLPDRPKVAAVFWNRIRENWRLDSDVTLHYALNKWGKGLTKSDLSHSTPYNTRKYKGFPPTPICNPSLSSLRAAFYPDQNDYFFFIASGDSDGHCLFSKDLKEHNRIKQELKKQGKLP